MIVKRRKYYQTLAGTSSTPLDSDAEKDRKKKKKKSDCYKATDITLRMSRPLKESMNTFHIPPPVPLAQRSQTSRLSEASERRCGGESEGGKEGGRMGEWGRLDKLAQSSIQSDDTEGTKGSRPMPIERQTLPSFSFCLLFLLLSVLL